MTFEPDDAFREALTKIDTGEADLIVVAVPEVAQWAAQHGYRIIEGSGQDLPVFEIRPAPDGVLDPPAR